MRAAPLPESVAQSFQPLMVRKCWRSSCEHVRTAVDAASKVSCMLVAVTLPVHHATIALQPRQCSGRASQWWEGERWQSCCRCIMRRVHCGRGNTPGGHPSGRSRQKGLLAATLQVHPCVECIAVEATLPGIFPVAEVGR